MPDPDLLRKAKDFTSDVADASALQKVGIYFATTLGNPRVRAMWADLTRDMLPADARPSRPQRIRLLKAMRDALTSDSTVRDALTREAAIRAVELALIPMEGG